jgi:NAD-dependent DNA ligase
MKQDNQLDIHGQPRNIAFNYKNNKTKAVLTLKGIIDGILADVVLNDIEVIYLKAWCCNDTFNFNDGDFIDIREQIGDILEDGLITSSEQKDMQQMLNDILEYCSVSEAPTRESTNYLLGFLSGISADDVLNDDEIYKLRDHLSHNADFVKQWPANALKARLDSVLEDGIIDDSERHDLMSLVKAVSGQSFLDTGLAYGMSADFSTSNDIDLKLDGLRICFTGTFISGSRKRQSEFATKLGATVSSTITQKLDVLVLGSIASRDWKFSSYGTKIAAVLSNRVAGSTTQIINEELWNDIACNSL